MRRRFALVYNATAGVARPRLLDRVLKSMKDSGCEVFQLATRSAEEAIAQVHDLASRRGADAVIAAGGDGTFRAVATGAAGTSLPVGVIPLGTGNVVAHEIGVKRGAGFLANVLQSGNVIEARGGLVNGQPFFLMAGAGFDGAIVSKLNYRTKRVFGRMAYTAPVLKTLATGPVPFDAQIDGRTYLASWVIITNAARYGGAFRLTGETALGVDGLIAVVVEAPSRLRLVEVSMALGLGRLIDVATRPKHVTVLPCHSARLGFTTAVATEIDGDASGITSMAIESGGPQVNLIVPPAYVAGLTNRHTNHVP